MTGVEIERLGERGRRRLRHLSELVDHARLGQRVRRIEQALVQEADLARPEAAEAAGAVGAGAASIPSQLPAIVNELLVDGKYIARVDPVQRDAGDDEADARDLPAARESA